MKKMNLVLLTILLFSVGNLYAQRTCGHHHHTEQLLQNNDYLQEHNERQQRFNAINNSTSLEERAQCSNPVTLPMAVHYQGVNNPDEACLIALAYSQIQILNDDYAGTNADISQWNNSASSYFSGVSNGETCIDFCLATSSHPSGYGLVEGEPAVTINEFNSDFNADFSGYINIFVRDAMGDLGYSPLGGNGNGDGVVIDKEAFGSGSGCGAVSPYAPYDLGRTLTHELGHYLNLNHIWANTNEQSGCNNDDGVAETPIQQTANYGCPSLGAQSCNTNDMHMNYMDYTNDACMYMFSAGQSARMENYVAANLQNVVNNAANVCGSTPTGCNPPTTYAVDVPTTTSATFTWDAVADATKYQVKYRIKGTTAWLTQGTTGLQRTITGLTPKKYYQYKLRTECGTGNWSDFSDIELFYTSTCDAPTGVASIYLDNTRMRVRWDNNPDEIKGKVRYREVGTSTWYTQNSAEGNNYLYLSDLPANATIQYRVRSNCDGNDWSEYTESYFHELSTGARESQIGLDAVNIYPNPAKEILNLQLHTIGETQISISDVSGRLVLSQNVNITDTGQTEILDISKLVEGYHILTITTNEGIVSKKFVVVK